MSLDDQIREAVERALAGARGHFESSIRSVAYDVARAAAEERNRAVLRAAEASATDMRQKAHAQLTQFRDATLKHQNELRRSAAAQIHEITCTLDEVHRAAQIKVEVLRRKAQADLDAAQQRAQGEVEDARRKSHAHIEDIKRLMEQRLTEVHGRLADAQRRLIAAGHEMQAVRKAAAADAEELIVAQLAVAATSSDTRLAEVVEQERAAARQLDQEQPRRLVNAMRAFDDARSLGEVLEVLVQRAAREVERVAVLVSRGDRLTGWSLMGFGEQTATPRAIDLDLDEAGLAGLVIRTGVSESRDAADAGDHTAVPPFARGAGSRNALALPVVVGGTAVAVLYADALASDRRGADRWPAILDVLARHVGKVLEALTVQRVVGLPLSRSLTRSAHDVVAEVRHDRGVQ